MVTITTQCPNYQTFSPAQKVRSDVISTGLSDPHFESVRIQQEPRQTMLKLVSAPAEHISASELKSRKPASRAVGNDVIKSDIMGVPCLLIRAKH